VYHPKTQKITTVHRMTAFTSTLELTFNWSGHPKISMW